MRFSVSTLIIFSWCTGRSTFALVPGSPVGPNKQNLVRRSVASLPPPTSDRSRSTQNFNDYSDDLAAEKPRIGNLAFIDDTWRIIDDDEQIDPAATLSDARVTESLSMDTTLDHLDTSPRAWAVRSPITFEYRVVECPGLLEPSNNALLVGHLEPFSAERAAALRCTQRRLIVIDETVDDLFGEDVRAYFDARDVTYEILRLPLVEEEKDMEMVLKVCSAMKKFNVDRRNEPVIAIGGGVALDIVGLACTLFRRKTPYIRVPTTTLSYVDASVGAKSGVNFMGSKNRLGAYVPPVAALLDSSFLRTEDTRAVASGVAEMAKMAIMKSPELFEMLEAHAPRLVSCRFQRRDADDYAPAEVLRHSISTMLEELAPNLWEKSLDRLVDFGHTVGQELEMHALGTEHELTHGESVAVDMAYMTCLSNVMGLLSNDERDRTLAMLRGCGVPVHSPLVDRAFILHAMAERRKQSMGLRLPLPVGIGQGRLFRDVDEGLLFKALDLWTTLTRP